MTTHIQWGCRRHGTVDVEDDNRVWPLGDSHLADPLDDLEQAVRHALSNPLDFPALAQATVEGDHVAVALDPSLPAIEQVARGVVAGLVDAGVDTNLATVVVSSPAEKSALAEKLEPSGVTVDHHDANDADQLCYVGEMQGDVTLRMNRWLFEADLVIPVGCGRPSSQPGSQFECLFPVFADRQAQRQFAKPLGGELASRRREAGWMLGSPVLLEVVPAPVGGAADVKFGTPDECHRQATAAADEIWHATFPSAAQLVVATMADDHVATWQQLARTLQLADSLRVPGGGIAICVDLPEELENGLASLRNADDPDEVLAQIRRNRPADIEAAEALVDAIEGGPVYLLSNLPGEIVEDLGMAPIAGGDELQRLVGRMESWLLVEQAQFATAEIDDSLAVPGTME